MRRILFLGSLWIVGQLASGSAPAAAQEVALEFDPDRFSSDHEAQDYIDRAAMGGRILELAIDRTAGTAQVTGVPARLFRADPAFLRVTETAPPQQARIFDIHLDSEMAIARPEAPVRMRTGRRTGWPGEQLRIVAQDSSGNVIAETFIADPRFVRHEGWTVQGEHIAGSNRSHIQDAPLPSLSVSLPEATARIAVYDRAGSRHAPEAGRRIGLIEPHQIVESGQ